MVILQSHVYVKTHVYVHFTVVLPQYCYRGFPSCCGEKRNSQIIFCEFSDSCVPWYRWRFCQSTWYPVWLVQSAPISLFVYFYRLLWMNFLQHGRLPSAPLAPSQFGKDAMLKNEIVFSSKNTLSLSYFLISPMWSFLWFPCQNTSYWGRKRHFQKLIIRFSF